MKKARKWLRDERGEAYVDVAIAILILVTFMASLLAIFPIFTTQQSLNNNARQLVRTAEITGRVGPEVQDALSNLPCKPDSISWDAAWYDAASKEIQIKTPFTLTVTKQVQIVILKPAFGDPLAINVTVSAFAIGISEVYWK